MEDALAAPSARDADYVNYCTQLAAEVLSSCHIGSLDSVALVGLLPAPPQAPQAQQAAYASILPQLADTLTKRAGLVKPVRVVLQAVGAATAAAAGTVTSADAGGAVELCPVADFLRGAVIEPLTPTPAAAQADATMSIGVRRYDVVVLYHCAHVLLDVAENSGVVELIDGPDLLTATDRPRELSLRCMQFLLAEACRYRLNAADGRLLIIAHPTDSEANDEQMSGGTDTAAGGAGWGADASAAAAAATQPGAPAKQPPLFPALQQLLGSVMPDPHVYVEAGEVIGCNTCEEYFCNFERRLPLTDWCVQLRERRAYPGLERLPAAVVEDGVQWVAEQYCSQSLGLIADAGKGVEPGDVLHFLQPTALVLLSMSAQPTSTETVAATGPASAGGSGAAGSWQFQV